MTRLRPTQQVRALQKETRVPSEDPVFINIAPLLPDHVDNIVEDLVHLWDEKAISAVAFCCTLVPEGHPPHDKAARLAELFARYRDALAPSGLPTGILLQATMGHGWKPDEEARFQRLVFQNGKEPYIFCPLDPGFQTYVFDAVRTLAGKRPDFMMLDDDTRMITGRDGCFCPHHLAEFNQRHGTTRTREELVREIYAKEEVARSYDEFLCESMVRLARTVRRALDTVAPAMPCSFCLCAEDVRHAPAMTRALAAPGDTPMVRINHGLYNQDSPRAFPGWRLKTAQQRTWLPTGFVVLAEPDTCPQNRYSTSAAFLHAHVTWSLLEGLHGAKLWITRMSDFEPYSGTAYREVLCRHAEYYRELVRLRPKWISACCPLPPEAPFNFPFGAFASQPSRNWGRDVFGRMGIPYHHGVAAPDLPALLTRTEVDGLDDETLRRVLSGRVLLDGGAAIALTDRGLSSWTGVDARPWTQPAVTFEAWNTRRIISSAASFADLRPMKSGCEVLSTLFHAPYALSPKADEVGPGVLRWTNEAGGTVITLAACVTAPRDGFAHFNLLCEGRKSQFLSLLSRLDALPAYVPGDAEVMLNVGRLPDDGYLVAGLNIGLDALHCIPLEGSVVSDGCRIELLTPEGGWQGVRIRREGSVAMLNHPVAACTPFVLRIFPCKE